MTEKTISEYYKLKKEHPDCIFLLRTQDCYVTYGADATDVANICGLTVTRQLRREMTAFPSHALDTYLPKLIMAGRRVAICDNPEPPRKFSKRGCTESVIPRSDRV